MSGSLIGMKVEPAATTAAVIDVWNGAPVDRLQGLLAPDYRGHMLHVSDGERDAAAYPGLISNTDPLTPERPSASSSSWPWVFAW